MAIKDLLPIQKHLFLCNGGTCKLKGAEEGSATIRQEISQAGLTDQIHTTKTLCNGRCKDGPVVISMPEGIWFKQLSPECAADFVKDYILEGKIQEKHLLYKYDGGFICPVETEPSSGIAPE
jgi:(2Fe-2S) ferredoxin